MRIPILSDILGSAHHDTGVEMFNRGEYAVAMAWFRRAIETKEKGNGWGQVNHGDLADSQFMYGRCLVELLRYEEAIRWFRASMEAAKAGYPNGQVSHHQIGLHTYWVAYSHYLLKDYREASIWLRPAAHEFQLGDPWGNVSYSWLAATLQRHGFCLFFLKNYTEAFRLFTLAAESRKKAPKSEGLDRIQLGNDLHLAGLSLFKLEDYGNALKHFEWAIEAKSFGDNQGRQHFGLIGSSMHFVGECLANLSRYDEALEMYRASIEKQRLGDPDEAIDTEVIGRTVTSIGVCYRNMEDYSASLESLFEALSLKQLAASRGQDCTNSISETMLSLSLTYHDLKDYASAVLWSEKALALEETRTENERDYAHISSCCFWIADAYFDSEDYDSASTWGLRAVLELERYALRTNDHTDSYRYRLNLMGRIYYESDMYEEAIAWTERAIRELSKESSCGKVDYVVPTIAHSRLGHCLFDTDRYDEALEAYVKAEQAIRQSDGSFKDYAAFVGTSLANQAKCHEAMGDRIIANQLRLQAIDEYEKGDASGRVGHHRIADCLFQIAQNHFIDNEHPLASQFVQRAVAEAEMGDEEGKVDHVELSDHLVEVAKCYSRIGNDVAMENWYLEALRHAKMGDESGKVDSKLIGELLFDLGSCHCGLKNVDTAIRYWEESVAVLEADEAGTDNHLIGRNLLSAAYQLKYREQYAKAIEWFSSAVRCASKRDDAEKVDFQTVGDAELGLAECHHSMNDLERALAACTKALEAYKNGLAAGQVVPGTVVYCQKELALYCAKLSDLDRCQQLLGEAVELRCADCPEDTEPTQIRRQECSSIGHFLMQSDLVELAKGWFMSAFTLLSDMPFDVATALQDRMWCADAIAECCLRLGDNEEALRWSEQQLEFARAAGELDEEHHYLVSEAVLSNASCLMALNRHRDAISCLNTALHDELARTKEDERWVDYTAIATLSQKLGLCHSRLEEHDEAVNYYAAAVEATEKAGDEDWLDSDRLLACMTSLAEGLRKIGRDNEAEGWERSAHQLSRW